MTSINEINLAAINDDIKKFDATDENEKKLNDEKKDKLLHIIDYLKEQLATFQKQYRNEFEIPELTRQLNDYIRTMLKCFCCEGSPNDCKCMPIIKQKILDVLPDGMINISRQCNSQSCDGWDGVMPDCECGNVPMRWKWDAKVEDYVPYWR